MADERKDYPAFPVTAGQQVYASGMSLRDWFAGQVLAGMCAHPRGPSQVKDGDLKMDAELTYRYADAMLQARQKGGDA